MVIRVWQASVIKKSGLAAEPGEIIGSESHGIDVATGENILRIEKLQLPGGRVLSVSDIIHAKHAELAAGKRLGK